MYIEHESVLLSLFSFGTSIIIVNDRITNHRLSTKEEEELNREKEIKKIVADLLVAVVWIVCPRIGSVRCPNAVQ